MRTFVVKMNNSEPEINVKSLAAHGRYDLAARCISSALWLSHDIRKNSEIYIILEPLNTILHFTPEIEKLNPNERSIALWMKKILKETHTNPGIEKLEGNLESLLEKLKDRSFYLLDIEGRNYKDVKLENDSVFILGDNEGLTGKDLKLIDKFSSEKLSLGEKEYLTSNCIGIINFILD